MRCAVVGHVEWTEFALVDHVPGPGQIAHATSHWAGPAGGGAVVAAQLRKLAGACDFYTALGEDELGRASIGRLEELELTLHVEWFGETRRALTLVDEDGERTITTIGPKLRPNGPLPLDGYDAVFAGRLKRRQHDREIAPSLLARYGRRPVLAHRVHEFLVFGEIGIVFVEDAVLRCAGTRVGHSPGSRFDASFPCAAWALSCR